MKMAKGTDHCLSFYVDTESVPGVGSMPQQK